MLVYVQAAKPKSPLPITEKRSAQPETQEAQTVEDAQETAKEAPREGPLGAWNLARSPSKGGKHKSHKEYLC